MSEESEQRVAEEPLARPAPEGDSSAAGGAPAGRDTAPVLASHPGERIAGARARAQLRENYG